MNFCFKVDQSPTLTIMSPCSGSIPLFFVSYKIFDSYPKFKWEISIWKLLKNTCTIFCRKLQSYRVFVPKCLPCARLNEHDQRSMDWLEEETSKQLLQFKRLNITSWRDSHGYVTYWLKFSPFSKYYGTCKKIGVTAHHPKKLLVGNGNLNGIANAWYTFLIEYTM